jgi:NADPH:quinone reductase-like Zn-dependent oxidoreductase
MKRIVVRRAGGWERLEVETAPDPEPGPGEVVVRTDAAGVNYADVIVRMGLYESAKKYVGWPITPGFEFAGTVAAVGADVTDVTRGARAVGVTRFGGYATHVVVPADQVLPMPRGATPSEAAALPAVYLTAWYALFELAAAKPDMRVLVHSAAGGVG